MKILKKVLEKTLELILRAASVTAIIIPTANALIDAAYAERGYSAIGGEWIAIIAITGALWGLSGQIIKYITADNNQQKGREKP